MRKYTGNRHHRDAYLIDSMASDPRVAGHFCNRSSNNSYSNNLMVEVRLNRKVKPSSSIVKPGCQNLCSIFDKVR